MLQVHRTQPGTPRVVHLATSFFGHSQQICQLQRDRLLRATAVFIHQDELHIHGVGVAQRDRRLHPLEQHLELAAKRIRPRFELAKILHAYPVYNGCRNPTVLVAQLTAQREFRLTESSIEDPGPGEVQVRVNAVGICGSDVHSYAEGGVGDTPCQFPMVLCHEPAGTVVKTGTGVTGWQPGDRAALEPAIYCYHCEFCRSGNHNICANIRFLSTPGHPGFFREFVNLPVASLLAIPPGLSLELATIVEPLAVAMHSLEFARIQPGETVAVFGAGPIGLLTIASLKVAGAGRIWAIDPVPHRRELARHMGAHATLDPSQIDDARQILADTANRGVDCAIDCAAKEDTINAAIRASRNGGRVVLTGIHSASMVPFEVSPMRRKELAIYNVRRSNHESHDALALLTSRMAWFAPLVTHTRPLHAIADAFTLTEHYADGVGKMVIV